MAAPITHIVLSKKVFDKFFGDKKKKEFFVGTSFPDIRYLKVINRKETHPVGLSIGDIIHDSSFLTGLKFHSILDQVREDFIVYHNIYSHCPKSKYITQSVKILEDIVFYDYIQNWYMYIGYFNNILAEEKTYGISNLTLLKWHNLLQEYFATKPNQNSIKLFVRKIGLENNIANEIYDNICLIENNYNVISIIHKLYQEFDQLLG